MKTLACYLLILSFSGVAFAEGLADRKNEQTHSIDAQAVIHHIHAMHGPTAAGPHGKMMGEKDATGMESMTPKHHYRGMRGAHEYHHLNAQQYKRKVFGSN